MKSRLVVAILSALALAAAAGSQQRGISLGGLDSGELREAELAQGTVIVVFWTSWSPRCRDIVERVNALQADWGDKARIVAVNFQEDPGQVRQFLKDKERLRVAVFLDLDGELSKKHRVNNAPWLLVMRDGRSAYNDKLPRDPGSVLGPILN